MASIRPSHCCVTRSGDDVVRIVVNPDDAPRDQITIELTPMQWGLASTGKITECNLIERRCRPTRKET